MNFNKNLSIRQTHMDQLLQFSWSKFFKMVYISHYLDCLYIISILNLRGSNANIVPSSNFVFEHGKIIL